jgi:hypothetical protein
MSHLLKFRSSIHPDFRKRILFKGFLKAAIGALVLLYGGIFLPLPILQVWGFPLFVLGFGFITWGLYPFKQLQSLETSPYEIVIEDDRLHLLKNGKPIFYIPLEIIDFFSYLEKQNEYGILTHLKPTPSKQVTIQNLSYKIIFRDKPHELFLPYFSKRTLSELEGLTDSTFHFSPQTRL